MLEQDLLEALIALPEQLFYNTGIATCVWMLTNRNPRTARLVWWDVRSTSNRYFYRYQPPRALAAIEGDIRKIDKDILGLLRQVAG